MRRPRGSPARSTPGSSLLEKASRHLGQVCCADLGICVGNGLVVVQAPDSASSEPAIGLLLSTGHVDRVTHRLEGGTRCRWGAPPIARDGSPIPGPYPCVHLIHEETGVLEVPEEDQVDPNRDEDSAVPRPGVVGAAASLREEARKVVGNNARQQDEGEGSAADGVEARAGTSSTRVVQRW